MVSSTVNPAGMMTLHATSGTTEPSQMLGSKKSPDAMTLQVGLGGGETTIAEQRSSNNETTLHSVGSTYVFPILRRCR